MKNFSTSFTRNNLTFQEETENLECEEEDSFSYFGICSACKLAINHYRHFNLSALDFLSARNNSCPFCGLGYRDSAQRRNIKHEEGEPIDEILIRERSRDQRSSSEPTVPSYRLPPIVGTYSMMKFSRIANKLMFF